MHPTSSVSRRTWLALVALALPSVALAHPGVCTPGFAAGAVHPLTGIDHLLAMLAVGWWSTTTQARRWWRVPATFAGGLLLGALVGEAVGQALPGGETVIALSLVVLGGLLVSGRRLPLAVACAIVGGVALFHGYAHGVEMPSCGADATPLGPAWLAGMVAATLALHLAGALGGRLALRHARWTTPAAGALTAFAGLALLTGLVGA